MARQLWKRDKEIKLKRKVLIQTKCVPVLHAPCAHTVKCGWTDSCIPSWTSAGCLVASLKKNNQQTTIKTCYHHHRPCPNNTIIFLFVMSLLLKILSTHTCERISAHVKAHPRGRGRKQWPHYSLKRWNTCRRLCGCQAPPQKAHCVLLTCHLHPLLSWCGDTLFLEMMEPFVCHQRDSYTFCYSWMALSSCHAKPVNVIRKLIHPIYK